MSGHRGTLPTAPHGGVSPLLRVVRVIVRRLSLSISLSEPQLAIYPSASYAAMTSSMPASIFT